MNETDHSTTYLAAAAELARRLDPIQLDAMARGLAAVRERGGRLFILGVGGGAGHASHAVNDFRKLCLLESYTPTDNVSELTARTNDDGWETSFSEWLHVSRLSERDGLLVFSVGGGSREHNVSTNLVAAMEVAHEAGASIYGVVGAPGERSPCSPTSRSSSTRRRRCAPRWSSLFRRWCGTPWSLIRIWPSSGVIGSRSPPSSRPVRPSGER